MLQRLSLPTVLVLLAAVSVASFGRPTKRLSDEAQGQLLYERHCMQCHGATGAGDGPLNETLVQPTPDLRDQLGDDTRDAHVRVVLDGRKSMPSFRNAFGRLEAERVMRHMERIAEPGYERAEIVVPGAKTPRPNRSALRGAGLARPEEPDEDDDVSDDQDDDAADAEADAPEPPSGDGP